MFSQNKQEVKLEWMYKGAHSTVDREEYLLGKSIDKNLEQQNEEERQQKLGIQPPKNHVEHECIPPSIRNYREQLDHQVDINAKLQEDPLIAIKKREEEKRRQFLNNPVQLKKLRKALKTQKDIKKIGHRRLTGSDSEDDLDKKLARKLKTLKGIVKPKPKLSKNVEDDALNTILMHKYNQLKGQLSDDDLKSILQGKVVTTSESDSEDDESSGSESSSYNRRHRKQSKSQIIKNRGYTSRSSSTDKHMGNSRKKSNRSFTNRDKYKNNKAYELQQTNKSNSPTHKDKNRFIDSEKERHKNRHKIKIKRDRSSSISSDCSDRYKGIKHKLSKSSKSQGISQSSSNVKKRLSEDEKEKKRKEMMQNASWRDSVRVKNVKAYREKDLKEEQFQKVYNPEFIQKELLKSANNSSVESRIKANINNIQRSKSDMNRHFSKR